VYHSNQKKPLKVIFFSGQSKSVKTDFMKTKGEYYVYKSQKLAASLLRLPYAGRKYTMFLILPDTNNNIDTLIENLNSKTLHREMWYLDEEEVLIELPKFNVTYPLNLKPHLINLGINSIFTENASLPLLARGSQTAIQRVLVSNIIQETGIKVDEEGTVAFGATQVQLINKISGKPHEFKANRPFLFYIEDEKSGNILFVGRIVDPTLSH